MTKKQRRILIIVLTLILSLSITITAFAETVRITDRNPDYEYFDYYTASGTWSGLLTPKHLIRDSDPEIVAYCLEHEADSPGSTYYDSTNTPFTYLDSPTYTGLLIILEYGYPYNTPSGLNADQARYATSNAIRFWLSERGMPNQYNFTNLSGVNLDTLYSSGSESSCYIRSNSTSGSLNTLRFAIDLLRLARSGERIPHTINFSPSSLDVTKSGSYYVATTTVTLTNMRGGYTLDTSSLPQGSTVTGFSGNSGDNITINIPVSSITGGQSFSITASGSDDRVPANLYWAVNPSDPDKQDVVYMATAFKPAGNGTLSISTPNLGYIEINKTDANTGVMLENVVFDIINSNSIVVDTLTTDENGYAKSKELSAGTYSLQETAAPAGYVIQATPYSDIQVTADNTTTVNITNTTQKGVIEIIKQDSETGDSSQGNATLNGAVFEIYDSSNTLIEQLDSGESNIVQSSELPLGDYTIKEITAPYGYLINDTSYPVSLDYDSQTTTVTKTVIVENDAVKGNVVLNKTGDAFISVNVISSDYGDVYEPIFSQLSLSEVVFDIFDSNDNLVETITTSADGSATSINLPLGTYKLIEVYTPDGYILDGTPIEVEFEYNDQTIPLITENIVLNNNQQSIEVNLTKECEVISWDTQTYSYQPAGNGYIFGVFADQDFLSPTDEVLIPQDSLISYMETDDNGHITFNTNLPFGAYYVQELKCPTAYLLDGAKHTFQISPQTNDVHIIEIDINGGNPIQNQLIKKSLQIVKVDSRDSNVKLEGAMFELLNSYGDVIQILTTNENGIAASNPLPLGEYSYREINAPDGYIFDSTEHDFNLTTDDDYTYSVTCENDPTQVTIHKIDKETDLPLANMTVGIFDEDGNKVFEGITDENGEVTTYCLSVGEYTFKELIAPVGFTLNPTVYEFELNCSGEVIGETTIENEPTEVVLKKTDLVDGRAVANAEIQIINAQNEVVHTGITDENGEITVTHLPIGTYTFKESKAPEGYILSDAILTFTIDEFGIVTGKTEMTNCPTTLEVYKVIYETNEPLSGAGFKVKTIAGLKTLTFIKEAESVYRYDENGTIEELFVDSNGQLTVYGLPYGSYWIEESTIPTGYFPSSAKKVTIGKKSTIDVPCMLVIPNSEFVKLGLDRERWLYPLLAGVLILSAIGLFFIIKRRKGGN